MNVADLGETGRRHLSDLLPALADLSHDLDRLARWGSEAAAVLAGGGRLLAAGNGGSAAQAQHLTAELVGRYRHERSPLSAIALTAETSSITAIVNDYGSDEVFARQVLAHGRPGDVLVALSTSGRSTNIVTAARVARRAGLTVWGCTGAAPNPVAALCHDVVAVAGPTAAAVQEVHLVAVHLLCEYVDVALGVDHERAIEGIATR